MNGSESAMMSQQAVGVAPRGGVGGAYWRGSHVTGSQADALQMTIKGDTRHSTQTIAHAQLSLPSTDVRKLDTHAMQRSLHNPDSYGYICPECSQEGVAERARAGWLT